MLETQTQIIGDATEDPCLEPVAVSGAWAIRFQPDFTAIAKEIVSQEGYIEDVVSQVEAILRREFA